VSAARLGFLGAGGLGRHRMRALVEAGAEAAAVCDPAPGAAARAAAEAPGCAVVASLDQLLTLGLDGIVVATPPALRVEQAIDALGGGVAVLCQAPLARTAAEARRVVEAAREADRLLRVDLPLRHAPGVPELRRCVQEGALGRVQTADLALHGALAPDPRRPRERARPGGGGVPDLVLHLVDLALWVLGFPEVTAVPAVLRSGGGAEDGAAVRLELSDGTSVRLSCSPRPRAGTGSGLEAAFHGTKGRAALGDAGRAFHNREAAVAWAEALAHGARFDPAVASAVEVHATLDRISGER
jgi:predicted dehydrogenase